MTSPEIIVKSARDAFSSGKTKSLEFRRKQIKNLLRCYEENTPKFLEALASDLRKSKHEGIVTEIAFLIQDVKHVLENLSKWNEPEKPPKDIPNIMDEVVIYNDPYGVVLIIGAWNYPLQVLLLPLASAIAAGNCVVLKPSELAPATAKIVAEVLPQYLDNQCYHVMTGGPDDTNQLLQEKFDYIFFTGSTRIGKLVHAAANKYLTPTTLELGGKSPVYLDESANINVAARRILWGKCMNAGQTCVAPDYILCKQQVGEKFIATAKNILNDWFGADVQKSPDFGRIINNNHFQRIRKLIDENKVALGGQYDEHDKFINLTILADVKDKDSVMDEEIFGPVLPILYVQSPKNAVEYINSREKPLALYIFSEDKNVTNYILDNTTSGGACVNDTVMQLAVDTLPFGGVGSSGMGSYHGKYTFDTFVHKRSVLIKDLGVIGESLSSSRYPPFTESKTKQLLRLLNLRFPFSFKLTSYLVVFGIGALTAIVVSNANKMLMNKKY